MSHTVHRDDTASKMGMWLFIFTEILLFGGLFIVYSVYRSMHPEEFHESALELNTFIGAFNTVILLLSSMCVAMSITAIQRKQKKLAIWLLNITVLIGLIFLFNKYIEWGHKFDHGIIPGSKHLLSYGHGQLLFFGLYYCMTGLHALHIIIGLIIIIVIMVMIEKDKITHDNFVKLENGGLYWHLVDLIWIFLFPLLYLIS